MMRALILLALPAAVATAQRGDVAGETQTPLPAGLEIPEARVHGPAEAAATFRVAEGFRLELFGSEPLVGDPVAATFDAAGRLWVVEMRGFMNDVDGRDELAKSGRIVVLEDRDRDGRADTTTVFADGLVLPRAVLPLRGGALVIEPPNLWWCADRDGDLRADEKSVVTGGFEAGLDNPEHAGNGLLWGLDHRIHLANDRRLLRWTPDGFVVETGAGGGQWGLTHDDRGRLYFNYNEDWLRCDLVPGWYGRDAASLGGLAGLNHRVCADKTVWPIRKTPGVNRGYQPGRLVDYVLAIHTAVCSPHVYRGERLRGCDGNVFVCEPAGHVVRRIVLSEPDGLLRGVNAYQAERSEFLASTDERFRPVSLLTGLDGALYVVDMYRGVIQHKNFVTTFLRRQILERGLADPIGLGRIWRIVPADEVAPAPAKTWPAETPAGDLVDALTSATGTVRDLALRDLVQRQERGAADRLRLVLADHPRAACRVVLLSALRGLEQLTATDLRRALFDGDPGVAGFALQCAAPWLAAGDGHLWLALDRLITTAPPAVRWQLALTLGDVLASGPARSRRRVMPLFVRLLASAPGDATLCAVVGVAAHPHGLEVLRQLLRELPSDDPERFAAVLQELARLCVRSRSVAQQKELFALVPACGPLWQRRALLRGAVAAVPRGAGRAGWLPFDATPRELLELASGEDVECRRLANELLAAVVLSGDAASAAAAELTDAERQRVEAGAKVYARACAACHQLDGTGLPGLAPPLCDSDWVLGAPDRLMRIALHGVRGPIEVNGTTWNLDMPGQVHLSDEDLAQVLSYVRRSFGHRANTVAPADVGAVRAANKTRKEPWTAPELLGTK